MYLLKVSLMCGECQIVATIEDLPVAMDSMP